MRTIKSFRQIYSDCSDIKMQEMYLGRDASIKCFVAYIEVTCAGSGINNSAFGRFTSYLEGIERDQVKEVLDKIRQLYLNLHICTRLMRRPR